MLTVSSSLLERMKTLRAVATGALGLSCLITLGAGLFALDERRRR
jgi:hypothetical protein